MQKSCFPAILVFFSYVGYKGSLVFVFCVFVIVCLSCVVCFHLKEFICIILFLCGFFFYHKTKWSSCLHLVVLLPFLFFVVLF